MDKCETDTEAEFKLLKFKENQTYKKHRKLKWSPKSVAFNIISTKHVVNKRTMYVHEGLSGIYGWSLGVRFKDFNNWKNPKNNSHLLLNLFKTS